MPFSKGIIPWNKIGEYKNCLKCGKSFYATPSDVKLGKAKYCSKKCSDEFRRGIPNVNLSKLYKGKKKDWLKLIKPNMNGENHWNWQGGITPINERIRKSIECKNWSKNIKERDNYECQICGEIGGRLRANHIKRFADCPDLRLVLSNGITICESCDLKWVLHREQEWESYFNFNLMARGYLNE